MRHASFFSGVGGLDLGFERAGITTVSVSEIDPYASSVLAERFPDAPNLGSITEVQADAIPEADIWSGGFPCQDLSVAGKRAGFAGKRSSLAFTFLDLVERRRPRWIVLENVPGLFSSNKGADFGRLLYEMEQLGYGVAWRTLDARYFGVAQRRRRVFIVGSLGSDRAGEVLFECEGCGRHPAPRRASWQATARGAQDGSGIAGDRDANEFISSQADSNGVRAADGMARRMDNQSGVEDPQRVGNFEMYDFPSDSVAPSMNALRARDLMAYQTRADEKNGNFSLSEADAVIAPTITASNNPSRSPQSSEVTQQVQAVFEAQSMAHSAGAPAVLQIGQSYDGFNQKLEDDGAHRTLRIGRDSSDFVIARSDQSTQDSEPVGLDSHRYRCCGNGVVANVAEWIGIRIAEVDADWRKEG